MKVRVTIRGRLRGPILQVVTWHGGERQRLAFSGLPVMMSTITIGRN